MVVSVLLNKKGMSLISILVAIFIFLVAMLGLLSGIITAIHLDTRNLIRNEAVRIVQETFDTYRNKSNTEINSKFIKVSNIACKDCLDNSSVSSACEIVTRQINNSQIKFAMLFEGESIVKAGNFINYDNITICWRYRGVLYQKKFQTIIFK
ncbi:type IV pilus modification PilV family protein [Hippea maritima]|uniref:Type II secretion system protein n=1 Tax=Hippea maritima (strain ATCC 700847 / DSM 10411 / MH2) TaxID=760142 RepID=F2LWB9_HIPMA|nr:hypothetical protein [Hippea maritima]AEA34053.1 hypothetical protein Hipma_1087 [Hippea maritima DSM 10411]